MRKRLFSMLSIVLLILPVYLIGFSSNAPVYACECAKRNGFEKEFEESKAVFSGEVIKIENAQPDAFVTLKIKQIWKGDKSDTIVIRTNNQGKACGSVFKKGEKYLVYAFDDGALRTTLCTRTAELKSAGDDLKELAKKDEQ